MFKKIEFSYESYYSDVTLLKEELHPIVQESLFQLFELNDQEINADLEIETKLTIKDVKKLDNEKYLYDILVEIQNVTEEASFTESK